MDKLKMMSMDKVQANIEKIKALFPNAVTEVIRNGEPTLAVDFDVLKQEMSDILIDDKEERYQFTWPDKKKSILLANAPVSATLRPCREESVDFDTTENLYIEGDNLDVLKLLQETYLGKIKMIYIDPPYNTGNDFVYNDDFAESSEEYLSTSGQYDDLGNRLVQNTESNGRVHTDWLNMIYPRLTVAKDLLSDDGIVFVSIDDCEVENLKKICDEIFGETNFVAQLATVMNLKGNNDQFGFAGTHEYTLVYIKNISSVEELNGIALTSEDIKEYTYEDNRGKYKIGATLMRTGEAGFRTKRPKGYYPIYVSADYTSLSIYKENDTDIEVYPKTREGIEMSWRRSPENLMQTRQEFVIRHNNEGISFYKKQRLSEDMSRGKKPKTLFYKQEYSSGNGTALIKNLFNGRLFDNPKPIELIKDFIRIGSSKDCIILDFFSGSATTAHAVMQLNAEDGGTRKFIMVQLPEICDKKSEAYKAGYRTICEIGKERIRRAGKKIKEELKTYGLERKREGYSLLASGNGGSFDYVKWKNLETGEITFEGRDLHDKQDVYKYYPEGLDVGFRVLKLDSSNMKDIFYRPADFNQDMLSMLESNIKEDRTALDLLFQVMLELGKPLYAKIEEKEIAGKHVFIVDENDLIACFDENVTSEVVKAIAEMKPLYAVFRDNSLSSDSVAANFDQIFATYSPNTTRKVL